MIKATLQPLPQPHRVVIVEDDNEKLQKLYDTCWDEVRKSISLPGFQKGRVPRTIAEKKKGAENIYRGAVDTIIKEGLTKIEEKFCEIGEVAIQWQTEKTPLVLTVKGYLYPEVISCDYRDIVSSYDRLMVTDEEVNSLLQRTAFSEAEEVEVDVNEEEDPSKVQVFIDFIMDDVENEKVLANQNNYKIDLSRDFFGFEKKILEHKKGEIFEHECTLPDDFFDDKLAGKKVRYQIKIVKMYKLKLPEITDELAKKVGYENLEEMRAKVIKDLEAEKRKADQILYRDHIMSLLVAKTKTTPIPDAIIKDELEKMLGGAVRTANQMQGSSLTVEQFLRGSDLKREDWFNSNWLVAQKKIVGNLALMHIAEQEKIKPTEEQCDQMLKEMLPEGIDIEKNKVNAEGLEQYALLKMTQDWLIELIEQQTAAEKEEKKNE